MQNKTILKFGFKEFHDDYKIKKQKLIIIMKNSHPASKVLSKMTLTAKHHHPN